MQTVSHIMIPIFEMFLMCREGTTIGYEETGEGVKPVCREIPYREHQIRMMESVQAGIMSFQNVLYSICDRKGEWIAQRSEELLKIAARLTALPLKREAELIGKMQYDQNFGLDQKWQIIDPENLNHYKNRGYNEFVYQKFAREDEWYQGMDVCIDGMISYRQIMFPRRNGVAYQYAMYVERFCHKYPSFVLVGAGKRLKEVLLFLNLMGETGRMECIVDNNPLLQGEKILGYPVYSMERETNSCCYIITVSQRKAIRELTEQLYKKRGPEIKIESLYA
ncbi:MAG: hypothetical protein HFI63_06445 [Lachnospiraceae bacterium]|nr:hypothetical protein [Lachnospiraceae bacterium]